VRGDQRLQALAQALVHVLELGEARGHEPVLAEVGVARARRRPPLARDDVLRVLGEALGVELRHAAVHRQLQDAALVLAVRLLHLHAVRQLHVLLPAVRAAAGAAEPVGRVHAVLVVVTVAQQRAPFVVVDERWVAEHERVAELAHVAPRRRVHGRALRAAQLRHLPQLILVHSRVVALVLALLQAGATLLHAEARHLALAQHVAQVVDVQVPLLEQVVREGRVVGRAHDLLL